MLPNYQLKIANLYNIPICNVKNLVCNFFDKERLDKLATLFETRIKTKRNTSRIRIVMVKIGMVKTIY